MEGGGWWVTDKGNHVSDIIAMMEATVQRYGLITLGKIKPLLTRDQLSMSTHSLVSCLSYLMIFPLVFEQRIILTEALNCDVVAGAEISCDIKS